MKIFTEKEAEPFLEKRGFKVVESIFVGDKTNLRSSITKIGFPLVIKISGKNILHKKKIGGVKTGINSYLEAEKTFLDFNKINKNQGVIIQKQISGKEFILGIKATQDFGKAIAFGVGGSNVEKVKKISFRICPISKEDGLSMIDEISSFVRLTVKEKKEVLKNLIKLSKLTSKYPSIEELDINPLMLFNGKALVVDARIFFS